MTNAQIADAARHALEVDSIAPHHRISLSVEAGTVTLTGSVDYTSQRMDAARAVGEVPGVHQVINRIVVTEPRVAPHALRAAIQSALAHHVEREVRDLQLDIVDGCVTVTGNVGSAAERRAIIGAVTGMAGVDVVLDQVHVVAE